ncbi:hypothetical protein [Ureibacillus acetophenoni]|uniref:Uncharacterized protein n=1 Tax=Ureibacillus acetophenoni TaxID=614649 RepID=A0A285U3G0_9BACL|nr:hypothetical protein [Ureibacillus acetophenoni]SOC35958.1 hypothetical protein SAMN05877842_10228 [Ureibacillus acetophenoni]
MWVVTVFEQNSFRMFEFEEKNEAAMVMANFTGSAILSYTK